MKDLITKFAETTTTTYDGIGVPNQIGTNADAEDLPNAIIRVVNWVIGILGLVAVIVMIIGGVQYMTSSGDPGKVKKAKDTILYGIIGLVVVILSAAIVNFVIANMVTN